MKVFMIHGSYGSPLLHQVSLPQQIKIIVHGVSYLTII